MTRNRNHLLARVGTALYQQDNLQQADLDAVYDEIEALVAKVESLRATVAALRASVPPTHPSDYGHEVWSTALRAERAAERAAVVAWLRSWDGSGWAALDHAATTIERGEHRRKETK